MSLKYYLATGARNTEAHKQLVQNLRARFGDALELTYNWALTGPAEDLSQTRQREIAEAELEGVRQADVLIILWPGSLGTHCELGVALAMEKPVFLYTPVGTEVDRFCIFHHAHTVTPVYGMESLYAQLADVILLGTKNGSNVA